MKFRMNPPGRYFFCLACATALSLSTLRAQVVADGATNTLNNVTNSITGTVTVGTNGPFTTLILTNGALLTNTTTSTIGANSSSKSNFVWLTSPNTRWFMGGALTVGSGGAANQLLVSNGGVVRHAGVAGVTLGLDATSSNNLAIVTGAGSLLTNAGNVIVGYLGSGNQLVVSNNGVVRDTSGYLGYDVISSNNVAVVTGAGSLWANATLRVGHVGSRNQLVVSAGAMIGVTDGYVGFAPSSSNNVVVVTGPGSLWSSSIGLNVGYDGSRNQLVVSNGAVVENLGGGTVGARVGSSDNMAIVTGAGSQWNNASVLYVGEQSSGNQLVVSNGGVVQAATCYFGRGGSNNVAVVTGAGSIWSISANLIGGDDLSNLTVVSNGGFVTTSSGNIGGRTVVTGTGSVCTAGSSINVRGQLMVTGGGLVQSDGVGAIGSASSISNEVVVAGAGSVWTNAGMITVGNASSGNRLVVSNGGFVGNTIGTVSGNISSNNLVLVTGAGSVWANVGDLTVGSSLSDSSGNQLVVSNGGMVRNLNANVGRNDLDRSNVVVVTGTGSMWSNAMVLNVGYNSPGNQLVVSNGGWVRCTTGQLSANSTNSINNVVVVTGAGSVWTNSGLLVGRWGTGNRLVVSNGGFVGDAFGDLGLQQSSSNNAVVVTGAGSVWSNAVGLNLGTDGPANQLVVSNGGAVFVNTTLFLGANSSSINNRSITDGGALCVTNTLASGVFDLRRGTNVLNAGTNEVDRLVMTNTAGFFAFNGGVLNVRTSTVNNGVVFTVGNGSRVATYRMSGTTTNRHNFANALLIASNATFTGNGTVIGTVTVQSGGTLSPGIPQGGIGTVVLSNSPTLQGAIFMEISKNGVALTNDRVQVAGPLTYGGSLTVSNLGPTALVVGDRFQLFAAGSYAGSFTPLTLPPLGAGLVWMNKLLLDGSIEVAAAPPSKFSNVTVVGTNLVITGTGGTPGSNYVILTATNIVQPLSNWVRLRTNQFDLNGNFSFTNGIAPGEPRRYFRFRTP